MEVKKSLKTNNLEMFQKAVISLSPETKRPKEKFRSSKLGSRTSSRKPKEYVVKSHLKALSDTENGKARFEVQPLKTRLTEKLRSLKSCKSKSSEVVGKRKALGVLQPSSVSNLTSSSPAKKKLDQDLQRVLGRDHKCSLSSKYGSKSSSAEARVPVVALSTSPDSDSPSSVTEMELTPKKSPDGSPLRRIAANLAQSLQTDVYFPNSSYLIDTKAELRKVMKQSDPEGYQELLNLLSARKEQKLKRAEANDDTDDRNFTIQPSSYLLADDSDCLSSLTLLSSSETSPPSHPSHPLHLLASPFTQSVNSMALVNSVEVESSASLCVSTAEMCPPAASMDFLDLMDSGSNNSSELTNKSEGANPSRWLPTPDRPRMFPRKLY